MSGIGPARPNLHCISLARLLRRPTTGHAAALPSPAMIVLRLIE